VTRRAPGGKRASGASRAPRAAKGAKAARARRPDAGAPACLDWPSTLWSSWRMEYIVRADEVGCIFCAKPKEPDGPGNLLLHRAEHAFVILNAFPYNPGHVMVSPYRHVGRFAELSDEERLAIMDLLAMSHDVIDDLMRPHGANVGVNLGRTAGAGILGHIHVHLVPRWDGDTNFMPVVGRTKVIPEGLQETYRKLRAAFAARDGGNST
jgi:ATP adenylyltransferase